MKNYRQRILSLLLILLIIIGGCGKMETKKETRIEEDWKKEAEKFDNGKPEAKYTGEKEMFGEGYVNEDEVRKNGYVPVQEFKDDEKSIIRNKTAQEVIDKDREKIIKVAEKHLSELYNRKIKVTQLQAIYPYDAINVVYKSENEPIVESDVILYLYYNGKYKEKDFKDISKNIIKTGTADGIVTYAHQTEMKKLGQYILDKHPEYYANFKKNIAIDRSPSIHVSLDGSKSNQELRKRLYQLYQENPDRSQEEWLAFLQEEKTIMMFQLLLF